MWISAGCGVPWKALVSVFTLPQTAGAEYTNKVSPTETLTQSEFLLKMGLQQRVTKLVKESDSKRQDELVESANRLVNPQGMGGQYKIMGFRKGYVQEAWPFMKLRDNSVGETKL